MAQDFVDKLEHHLRTIIKQAEGERHWPDKYRVYFKVRRLLDVYAGNWSPAEVRRPH